MVGKAPPKWIYHGFRGDRRPLAAFVSSEWEEWNREHQRERRQAKRQPVLERDGMICQLCRRAIEDVAEVHIDHIVPVSKGGTSVPENLQVTHGRCNLRKGAREWPVSDT